MFKTWVTIGSNENPDYMFLVPFTALLWRDRIGFEPIVMKVGNWMSRDLGNVAVAKGDAVIAALLRHNISICHVDPMPDLPTGRTAQQCREMVGCLPLPPEDWAMPADADLWPIRREFYQQHQAKPGRVTSYYSNGDHYQSLPTCHVTMQIKKWRELYKTELLEPIAQACKRNLDEWLPKRRWGLTDMGFTLWMADQWMVGDKVFALPEGYEKIERHGHPPVDRLDRNGWPENGYDPEIYVDAHMPRDPDSKNWAKVIGLFTKLLPQHHDWAIDYHRAYTEVMKCDA